MTTNIKWNVKVHAILKEVVGNNKLIQKIYSK